MKNFVGRLIVLISGVINIVVFLVITGTFVFYSINDFSSIVSFFTGKLISIYYISSTLESIVFGFYVYLTIHSLNDITKGKAMKKDLIVSIFMLMFLLASFTYNVISIPEYSVYYGFLYGFEVTLMVSTIGIFIGSLLNYHKDCK